MAFDSNPPRALGPILREWIERMGYRQKIDEARAVEAWAAVAGPVLGGVTERVWMKDGQLFVKVRSAAYRHQLHLQREAWRARLNAHVGREVVDEVVFR